MIENLLGYTNITHADLPSAFSRTSLRATTLRKMAEQGEG